MDLLIGTIAIVNNYKFITSDKKHFQNLEDIIPKFNIEYWI